MLFNWQKLIQKKSSNANIRNTGDIYFLYITGYTNLYTASYIQKLNTANITL